jgi:hypothetical protein
MATMQQNGSAVTGNYYTGGSTKNRGGYSPLAFNSSVLLGFEPSQFYNGVFGSTVANTANVDPLYMGDFPHNHVKPLAMRLGDDTENALLKGASVPSLTTGIHYISTIRTRRATTQIRAGNFNIYTGKFTVSPTVAVDNFGSDNEATVSRQSPGEFAYMVGKTPVLGNYAIKTG